MSNGMKIANQPALVAMKLRSGRIQDYADIVALMSSGNINIQPFLPWFTKEQVETFEELKHKR